MHFFWIVLTWDPGFSADTRPLWTNIHSAITPSSPATISDWLSFTKCSISQPTGVSTLHDATTSNSS